MQRTPRKLFADYWFLGPVAVLTGALLWLDLAGNSPLWQDHTLLTNFATEAIFAVAVVFGLDRILKSRSDRQWRPLGVMIAKSLSHVTQIDQTLQVRVLGYLERKRGPLGKHEATEWWQAPLLLEALSDIATWEGDGETPDLLSCVRDEESQLRAEFAQWSPVLIAEASLTTIASQIPDLIQLAAHIVFFLEGVVASVHGHDPVLTKKGDLFGAMLAMRLIEYRVVVGRFRDIASAYTGEEFLTVEDYLC